MAKRPSFQFYPGDWLRDTALRSCSVAARGLWLEMICLMHEGTPYGTLKVGEKVILPSNLCRMVGATLEEVEGWLRELRDARVYSVDDEGAIYSRRMKRDEEVRQKRAAGGILGGNPALMGDPKVGGKVNLRANLRPTPSSSSPLASSIEEKDTAAAADSRVLDDCGIEIAEEADQAARSREKRARVAYLSGRIPGLDDAAKADGCADWWSWRMATVAGAKKPNAWRQLCQLRKLCKWSLQHKPAEVLRLVGMAQKNGWGGIEWSYLSGNGSGARRPEAPSGESPAQAAARMRAAYMKGREA